MPDDLTPPAAAASAASAAAAAAAVAATAAAVADAAAATAALASGRRAGLPANPDTIRAEAFGPHHDALVGMARLSLSSIILANGAAAAAVLAFLGTVWGTPGAGLIIGNALIALWLFGGGTFAAILAAGASYASLLYFMAAEFGDQTVRRRRKRRFWAGSFRVGAIALALLGTGLFAAGAISGLDALQQARPTP